MKIRRKCATCGTRRFRTAGDGSLVCQYGHQYLGFRKEEAEDTTHTFKTRKKVNLRTNSEDFYDRQTDTVLAVQFALQVLSRAMVQDLHFPPMLEHTVRELWLLYISDSKTRLSYEYLYRVDTSTSLQDNVSLDLIEEDNDINTENTETKEPVKQWPILAFDHCLVFLYLACVYMDLPVFMQDIIRWCATSQLPYRSVIKRIPREITKDLAGRRWGYLATIKTSTYPTIDATSYARCFTKRCNVNFPNYNVKLYLRRLCSELCLPVEGYYIALDIYTNNRDKESNVGLSDYSSMNMMAACAVNAANVVYGLDDNPRMMDRCSEFNKGLSKEAWLLKVNEKLKKYDCAYKMADQTETPALVKTLDVYNHLKDIWTTPAEKNYILKGFTKRLHQSKTSYTDKWPKTDFILGVDVDYVYEEVPLNDAHYLYIPMTGIIPNTYQIVIQLIYRIMNVAAIKLEDSVVSVAKKTKRMFCMTTREKYLEYIADYMNTDSCPSAWLQYYYKGIDF